MNNELIKIDQRLLTEINSNSIGSIIKPLKKEIPLTSYYVDDVNQFCSDVQFAKIKVGDELRLVADDMPYRSSSVGVYLEDKRIGELYKGEDIIPCNLLKFGKELKAVVKVAHISVGEKVLQLSLSLLDF